MTPFKTVPGQILIAVAILAMTSATAGGQEVSLVSPSAFEDVEAPDSVIPSGSGRVQILYEASDFSSLEGPHWITQFAWRPDGGSIGPVSATADSVVFRMSATDKITSNMNLVFDENVGADDMLVLQCAPCANVGQPIGPAGGPLEFTLIWELDTPFLYDSSRGSLLLDFDLTNGLALAADHIFIGSSPTTKWVSGPLGGSTAVNELGGIITEFTFTPVPEPRSSGLLLLSAAAAATAIRHRSFRARPLRKYYAGLMSQTAGKTTQAPQVRS